MARAAAFRRGPFPARAEQGPGDRSGGGMREGKVPHAFRHRLETFSPCGCGRFSAVRGAHPGKSGISLEELPLASDTAGVVPCAPMRQRIPANTRARSGQAMIEYMICAAVVIMLTGLLALLLVTVRESGGRAVDLVASEYP